jgi:hypothetical protein
MHSCEVKEQRVLEHQTKRDLLRKIVQRSTDAVHNPNSQRNVKDSVWTFPYLDAVKLLYS